MPVLNIEILPQSHCNFALENASALSLRGRLLRDVDLDYTGPTMPISSDVLGSGSKLFSDSHH
jgi:hypothetical protein